MTNDLYNCDKCNAKYPRDLNKRKENQKRLGCDGSVNPELKYTGEHEMEGRPSIEYQRCMGNFFNFEAAKLVRYIGKYNQNIFPFEGDYYDQPNKFVEAMDLVQNLVMELQSKKEKTLKRYNGNK